MTISFDKSYPSNLTLDGAVEHFADSLPIEWGEDLEEIAESNSIDDDLFKVKWKLNNTDWFQVEICRNEENEEWVCKAYSSK